MHSKESEENKNDVEIEDIKNEVEENISDAIDDNIEEVKEEVQKEEASEEIVGELKKEIAEEEPKERKQIIQYKTEKEKRNKILKKVLIAVIIFIVSISLIFSGIVVLNKINDKVYKNVYIFEQNMGGKTLEEIIEFLNTKVEANKENLKANIYQNDESIFTIESDAIDFSIDIPSTAQKIMDFGRSKNIFVDNFNIVKALFTKKEIQLTYSYNKEKLEEMMKNVDLSLEDRYTDDSFSIDEANKKLIIKKGKSGYSIDYEKEKEKVINKFAEHKEDRIVLDVIMKSPHLLDVDDVYNKVKRDAKDAYIDDSVQPNKFVQEIIGLDFKKEELIELLNKEENKSESKELEFVLTVTEPKVKLTDITYKLYKDKLAGYTTYFNAGLWGRSRNLEISLSYINGKIIMPGETFSYAAAVGDINASKGYQMASTFVGGKEVMDIGGGICQTVSTLYNTALLGNMSIVERHQHGLPVSYVRPSLDATVYVPVLDFKFKNIRKYPVKIVTSFSWGGSLNISLYGTKEEDEYEISLSSKYIRTIPFTTKYVQDSKLEAGKEVIDTKGVNGYVSESYITKKFKGSSTTNLLSKDTYKAQQQVIRVGPKKPAGES